MDFNRKQSIPSFHVLGYGTGVREQQTGCLHTGVACESDCRFSRSTFSPIRRTGSSSPSAGHTMPCQCLSSVSSEETFRKIVAESADHLLVFLFTAEWAPHASQLVDALTALMKDTSIGSIKYFRVEAESLPDISKEFGVQSIPSTLMIVKGEAAALVEGSDVTTVTKKIKELAFKHFPFTVTQIPSSAKDHTDLNDRLKALVSRSKVMLFIKGDRDTPRCGFTRQLLQILQSVDVGFDTFDILSDEEVRQGLKTYSNWPTYPQVYVNGNLIGGLDIVKELQEQGELMDTLRG